jgi:hypothetical protein
MKPFAGSLRKPIDLTEAPAGGLRAAFALPPDESDLLSYAASEIAVRLKSMDEFFGLNSKARDIWEQRAKALVARTYSVDPCDPNWWASLTFCLAKGHLPGLSLKGDNRKKKHGAPRQWTEELLAQLFADVEFLKKTTKLSVNEICKRLPRATNYVKRWGYFRPAGLRKQYLEAKRSSRGLLFQFVLCGAAATILANRLDPVDAAIELHALKRPMK